MMGSHSSLLICLLLGWMETAALSAPVNTTRLTTYCWPSTPAGSCQLRLWDQFFYGPSQVVPHSGHWPPSYCRLTNVFINTARKMFFTGVENIDSLNVCFGLKNIWSFGVKNSSSNSVSSTAFRCDQVFQLGHVFTMYYYHGSNYFHLHYDTVIPLFAALHYGRKPSEKPAKNVVLMPTVETKRGEVGTDWNTEAFLNDSTYWMEILKVVAEPYRILPLDGRLAAMQKTMCFKEVAFGTPKVNFTNPQFITNFVTFVKTRLTIPNLITPQTPQPVIGIIHRTGRRKILNEKELVDSLQDLAEAELIDFAGMSFKDQVDKVQRYTVLVGINGAGLMNALYLPSASVAIQLVPYEAQLNIEEFGNLLKARGPYLEWKNTHANLSESLAEDLFNTTSNTIVHVEELKAIVEKALSIANGTAVVD